jgi:signal transduction histidine kinase
MEEKNLNEIFALFYTTTSSLTGPDIGLYIIKETVEKLKGYITINSKKGHGTNIRVMVPDMGHKM